MTSEEKICLKGNGKMDGRETEGKVWVLYRPNWHPMNGKAIKIYWEVEKFLLTLTTAPQIVNATEKCKIPLNHVFKNLAILFAYKGR